MVIKNQRGQTMVEYLLLLAVVMSLITTFYRSSLYKKLFGANGLLGTTIKTRSEFSYRHALGVDRQTGKPPADIPATNRDISIHPSYVNPSEGGTRFFASDEAYPR